MNPGLHRFCLTSFRHWTRKLVPLSRPIRCKAKTKYNLVACVFPRFRQFVFFPSSSVVLNAQMAWVAEHFARVSPIPSHQSRCQNLTSLDVFTHVSSLEDVYIYLLWVHWLLVIYDAVMTGCCNCLGFGFTRISCNEPYPAFFVP